MTLSSTFILGIPRLWQPIADDRYILDHLSLVTQSKTHLFNTFFFTCLTAENQAGYHLHSILKFLDGSIKGHENVKRWTSKVDLFSKKYVVIPVNERYLHIPCPFDLL